MWDIIQWGTENEFIFMQYISENFSLHYILRLNKQAYRFRKELGRWGPTSIDVNADINEYNHKMKHTRVW